VLQTRTVTDPEGTRWRISIRWLPWKLRRRSVGEDGVDLAGDAGIGSDDLVGGIVAFLVVLVLVVVALPLLVFGIELLALLVVLLLGLLLAAVGVRRLTVEVERVADGRAVRVLERRCRGLAATRRTMRELAEAAERGELPLPNAA
jgi:hypothetical protein